MWLQGKNIGSNVEPYSRILKLEIYGTNQTVSWEYGMCDKIYLSDKWFNIEEGKISDSEYLL